MGGSKVLSAVGILCLWVCGLAVAQQYRQPNLNRDGFLNRAILADQRTKKVNSPHLPTAVVAASGRAASGSAPASEPHNLSGVIPIGVTGCDATIKRVFVLMDGQNIGEIEQFDSNVPFLLESDSYDNGRHSIKVAAVDEKRQVIVSKAVDVNFCNDFYYIIAPEYFEPNKDYRLMGFHDGNGPFEVKLTNHRGDVLWSNTSSGTSVNTVIPESAFGDAQLCKLLITETDGGMMAASREGKMAMAGDSGGCERKIHKKFVKENFIGVKMVLLLPNPDVVDAKLDLICTIISSCESQKVPYGVVYYKDNTPENWMYIFSTLGGRKDIYYGGHANSHVGRDEKKGIPGVQRTHLECYKDGEKIKAFSYTTQYEGEALPLPDNWDDRGFDLRALGLKDDDKIRIGWFDGCRTAGYELKKSGDIVPKVCCMDLAETFGFFSLKAAGNHRSIFFGWRIDTKSYPGFPNIYSSANAGQRIIWGNDGLGGGRTIQFGINLTDYEADETIQLALWGRDFDRDCDPDGDDNLFTYGHGDPSNMKLKWEE